MRNPLFLKNNENSLCFWSSRLFIRRPAGRALCFIVSVEASSQPSASAPGSGAAPVSVIIPCYRCVATIARAVASVLAQTQPVAEIILVDDASNDDTLTALHQLQALHSRMPGSPPIRVLAAARNGGAGEARNLGWECATQSWIAFLDADDAWHPRKIEIQYARICAQHDTVLSATATRVAQDASWDLPEERFVAAVDSRIDPARLPYFNAIPTRTVMVRRDIPWRFYPGKRYSEDFALWLKIVRSDRPAYKIDLPLACSFRPKYSPGGVSAQLWRQELGELDALSRIRQEGLMSSLTWWSASLWSLLKYARRVIIRGARGGCAGKMEHGG